MIVPDAPVNIENTNGTTGDKIRLTWKDGESNGGSNITGYTVFYDISGLDRYKTLSMIGNESKIFDTKELFPLTGLSQISFKIAAKNEVGLSLQSEPIHYVGIQQVGGEYKFMTKSES